MEREEKEFQTFDMQLAAYLEMRGLRPVFSNRGERVIFIYTATEELYRVLADFNADSPTPIVTYLNALRSMKNRVYARRVRG